MTKPPPGFLPPVAASGGSAANGASGINGADLKGGLLDPAVSAGAPATAMEPSLGSPIIMKESPWQNLSKPRESARPISIGTSAKTGAKPASEGTKAGLIQYASSFVATQGVQDGDAAAAKEEDVTIVLRGGDDDDAGDADADAPGAGNVGNGAAAEGGENVPEEGGGGDEGPSITAVTSTKGGSVEETAL